MSMDVSTGRAAGLVNDLNGAIRDNPLAAGLIGMGVAWMLFGGSKLPGLVPGALKSAATTAGSAASAAGTAVADGLSTAGSRIADASQQIKERVTDTASVARRSAAAAGQSASDTAPELYDAVAQAAGDVRARLMDTAAAGREYGSAIQARLADSLERQPLLLGAIGLAIGAGIASTFATTELEGKVMGAQGTNARETLQELAADAKKRAEQVVATVKDEAQKQGLTADAAKDAASQIAGKVKGVAGAARETVANRFSDQQPG